MGAVALLPRAFLSWRVRRRREGGKEWFFCVSQLESKKGRGEEREREGRSGFVWFAFLSWRVRRREGGKERLLCLVCISQLESKEGRRQREEGRSGCYMVGLVSPQVHGVREMTPESFALFHLVEPKLGKGVCVRARVCVCVWLASLNV